MPFTFLRPLWALIGMCVIPLAVHAQDQPDTTDQQLPEIAPREIEIRGELQVSFPSLDRQPLTGFASPPKIPSVPTDRVPYAAPYKQALEDLPESLPAPEAASRSVSQAPPAEKGFLEMGGGRYASRFAEGRYFLDLTPDQSLSFHADYFGTEGFTAFNAPDLNTPSDEFDGSVQFESRHDGFAIRTNGYGQFDSYTLYGVPSLANASDPTVPSRTGTNGGIEAQLRTFGSIKSRFGVGYAHTSYDTEALSPSGTFAEDRFQLNGRLQASIAAHDTRFDLAFDHTAYRGDTPGSSGFSVNGGAGLTVYTTDLLTLDAGARIMGFEAPINPRQPDPGSDRSIHVLPEARLEFTPTSGFTLFAENQPTLNSNGLHGLYSDNPYAQHAPSVRPTLYTTNAEAGLVTSLGPVRIEPRVGFRYAPTYQFFSTPRTASGELAGVMDVNYGSARILHGGGQLALQGINGIEASIGAYLRKGTLTGPDEPIPYLSPAVVRTMLSVSFAEQKGLVRTTGTIESARPINVTSDQTADAYATFDIEGSYHVLSLLSVVLEVRNLSPGAPLHWARYPRPPTTISAGFRIHL